VKCGASPPAEPRYPDRGEEIPAWGSPGRAAYDAETSRISAVWRAEHDAWKKECQRIGLEVNHIEPRYGRGYGNGCHNHLSNLETLCRACHVAVTKVQRAERAAGGTTIWWVYTAYRISRATGHGWNAWTYRGAVRPGDLLHATIEQAIVDSRQYPHEADSSKSYREEWWFAPIRLYEGDVEHAGAETRSLVKRKATLKPFAPIGDWPPLLLEF
jgi:HNH endonuclease